MLLFLHRFFLTGLVATNLELGKLKEAAACAREAISTMPRSSLGYLAMGMVFAVANPNSPEVCHKCIVNIVYVYGLTMCPANGFHHRDHLL